MQVSFPTRYSVYGYVNYGVEASVLCIREALFGSSFLPQMLQVLRLHLIA